MPSLEHKYYHLAVAGLLVHDRHIGPLKELHELHHGLRLVDVRGYRAQEIREALHRTQAWARGKEANLKKNKAKQ